MESGCSDDEPDTADAGDGGGGDAGVDTEAIRGQALGVRGAVTLELWLDDHGPVQTVVVDEDGAFELRVAEAATSFQVVLAGEAPCVLRGERGALGGDDADEVQLICEGVVELAALEVSDSALEPRFSPERNEYATSAPYFASAVTVTATLAYPGEASLEVDGRSAASGEPSQAMSVGAATAVPIRVTHPAGFERTIAVGLGRSSAPRNAAYGKPFETDAGDGFGASVSLDGDYLVVGAPGEDGSGAGVNPPVDDTRTDAGAVYVYRREADGWVPDAYLKAPRSQAGARFGEQVVIAGGRIVVGAPLVDVDPYNGPGPTDSGSVYVYRRDGATWSVEATLAWKSARFFGHHIAFDGETLVVSELGAVSIYRRQEMRWYGVGYLPAESAVVAVEGDTVAIGEPSLGAERTPETGLVRVYREVDGDWVEQTRLEPPFVEWGYNRFGSALALSDGLLAVAAPGDMDMPGRVHLYERSDDDWNWAGTIQPPQANLISAGGISLALAGHQLVVGLVWESSSGTGITTDPLYEPSTDLLNAGSGAVLVYRRTGVDWTRVAHIKSLNSDPYDHFGTSVALSGDTVAASAPAEDSDATSIGGAPFNEGAYESGAVYVLR